MNSGKPISLLSVALLLSASFYPQAALACAACAGRSDDAMARGMNMGIFALLVVIVGVLTGVASFAVFLARRAARFPVSSPSTIADPEIAADTQADAEAQLDQTISQPTP